MEIFDNDFGFITIICFSFLIKKITTEEKVLRSFLLSVIILYNTFDEAWLPPLHYRPAAP